MPTRTARRGHNVGRERKPLDTTVYSGRLAQNLRTARDAAGYTPDQVAERMAKFGFEVSPVTYRSWEGHRSRPDLDAIPALAKALKIKPHDILPAK